MRCLERGKVTDNAFTADELAREAEREVVMRELVFSNRVAAGTMREDEAKRRIAMMREIGRRLRAEAEAESPQRRIL
jgi:hypothetical protein